MKKTGWHFHHWLLYGIFCAILIYAAGQFFPEDIVLGNASVSLLAALVLASLLIIAVNSVTPLILKYFKLTKLNEPKKYMVHALFNIVVIWLLSRLATVFGFGLSSKIWAVMLGIVITLGQYFYFEILLKKLN